VRRVHTAVHADLARAAARGLGGPDEAKWMAELEASFDDVREAHGAAVAADDVDQALRIVIGVREYAWRRIRYEHLAWADVTVAMPGARDHALYPVALGVVAYGRFVRGELAEAVTAGEHAVAEAERLGALTAGLAERALCNALFYLQREQEAFYWWDRMVDAAVATGAPGIVAHAYYMLSVGRTSIGDTAGGTRISKLSAAAAIESGSPTALAQADYARAISLAATDPQRALALFDRSVERAEAVGNRWIRAFALTESLWIRAQRGDARDALVAFGDVVDTWFRGSDWANQWLTLRYVFAILESLEHDEVAATLYGGLEAAGVMQALPSEPSTADEFGHAVERLSARMDPTAFADAVDRGRALRDDELVRAVLREIGTL
jgi:hypothetical protein